MVAGPAAATRARAWGVQTARAVAASTSAARTAQRSREFLVEQHELQQLPPSGMIVSYASAAGRRVVFADANPAILTLPTATLSSLAEASVLEAGPPGASAPGASTPKSSVPKSSAPKSGAPSRPANSGAPSRPAKTSWPGPVAPPARDPAEAPLSWRDEGAPPPNLGPPPEPLDWRRRGND